MPRCYTDPCEYTAGIIIIENIILRMPEIIIYKLFIRQHVTANNRQTENRIYIYTEYTHNKKTIQER